MNPTNAASSSRLVIANTRNPVRRGGLVPATQINQSLTAARAQGSASGTNYVQTSNRRTGKGSIRVAVGKQEVKFAAAENLTGIQNVLSVLNLLIEPLKKKKEYSFTPLFQEFVNKANTLNKLQKCALLSQLQSFFNGMQKIVINLTKTVTTNAQSLIEYENFLKNPQSPQEQMATNLIHDFLNRYMEQALKSPQDDELVLIAKAIQQHNNDLGIIAH